MSAAPTPLEKLTAALSALPILDERLDRINEQAAQLLLVGGLSAVNDLRSAQRVGKGQALRELEQLRTLAEKLNAHILGLHRTSLDWIERGGEVRHWRELARDIEELRTAAAAACEFLKAGARAAQRKPGGRPSKRQAAAVRGQAAKAYERLTGNKPTVTVSTKPGNPTSGVWVRFLSEVFAALDIDASVQAQAKGPKEKTRKI